MVEKLSTPPDFITNPELEEGITGGRITTFTIDQGNLPFYQDAAIESGFEVKVIAQPGQHYITEKINLPRRHKLNANRQENKTPIITAEKSQFPVKKGSVAISLKRPPDVSIDTAFNLARQQTEQRKKRKSSDMSETADTGSE